MDGQIFIISLFIALILTVWVSRVGVSSFGFVRGSLALMSNESMIREGGTRGVADPLIVPRRTSYLFISILDNKTNKTTRSTFAI